MGAGVVEHAAPAGRRRWKAQSQEAERSLSQNGSCHADGSLHDDGLQDVGQDMAGKDAQVRGAQGAGSFHEFPLLDGEHLGPHQASVATHPPMARASTRLSSPGPRNATNAIASRMPGKEERHS